ncbi:Aste57867_24256 [Aphanomyces stellatus]|uniref:Aste57867_24256 protein n=1 Tax=Aphanomyces stellatus TaxID=120398 RepID=A0A485LUB0_9STRA|nr:hypothetical protein As57867_024181 [Aphanomyces stellatus]VFU00896.1 Aste57867_24256 [Aphanomyces stellatus]
MITTKRAHQLRPVGLLLPWLTVLVIACAVQWTNFTWRTQMPPAMSIADAAEGHGFAGENAFATYRDLANATFANGTVSSSPASTMRIYDVIHTKLQDLQTLNSSTKLVPLTAWQDLVNLTLHNAIDAVHTPTSGTCDVNATVFNASQIVVRVPGMFASSVLLSTHFEAGSVVGVAVALDILRGLLMADKRPRNSLLVFFNTGAVTGDLCGSQWFVQRNLHTLYHVETFVSLRGGAAGSVDPRAFLLRATDDDLARQYSHVAPLPAMNSIGGSLLHAVGARSGFATYQAARLEGVDIGFFNTDSLDASDSDMTPATMQHVGANVLAFARSLLETDLPVRFPTPGDALFFDLAGHIGFPLTADTRWTMLLLTLVAAMGVLLVHAACFEDHVPVPDVARAVVAQAGSTTAAAIALAGVGGVLATLPFLAMPLSWAVAPAAVLGNVAGATVVAELWRARHHVHDAPPPPHLVAQLATTGACVNAVLSFAFVLNAPALYLVPITTLTYCVLAMPALYGIAVTFPAALSPDEWIPLRSPTLSYDTISLGSSTAGRPATSSKTTRVVLVGGLVVAIYMVIAFHFGLDLFQTVQAAAENDHWVITALLPLLLTPSLHLLMPLFAFCDPREAKVYSTLLLAYAILFVAAFVSHSGANNAT